MQAIGEERRDSGACCFRFGDPEPVLAGRIYDQLGVWLLDNGRYYDTPIPWAGLARLLRCNAYHGPLIEFKTLMVMRGYAGSAMLPRRVMQAVATDWNVFANAYVRIERNGFGEVCGLRHLPAINMRRMKPDNQYCQLTVTGQIVEFAPGEVLHLKNYDVSQTIYGVPGYLGAIQSMLLNEDATLFRRKYYRNGAHMGYILYAGGSMEQRYRDQIEAAMRQSKGAGNFRNMFVHMPGGGKDALQILPVGDFSTRDELEKIKNLTRDDIIAAHRIPPALAAIIPTNTAGFGDVEKIDRVYQRNEVDPIREQLLEVNELLPPQAQVSFMSTSD
ncbi:MAG: hypothetical protein PWQ57_2010 [Desulfovibrionales bacterium]|jgi:PBSX family phage portal protein|nr:hypothetical protein [Desulfovibrionales bacterium]